MSRHTRLTLLIGLLSAFPMVLAVHLDVFRFWDQAMWEFLGFKGIVPAGSYFVQVGAVLLLSLGLAWTTADTLKPVLKVLVYLVTLSELFTASWLLAYHQSFFSPFASLIAGSTAFFVALIFSRTPQGERKRLVTDLFGARISAGSQKKLCDSLNDLGLDGADHKATILVVEIFNHQELLEVLPTGEYVALNNQFLSIAGDILRERGAYIDECDGGCLRAIFNVPVVDETHELTACRTALHLIDRLKELQTQIELRWEIIPDFRVGVDTGNVIGGVYGTSHCGRFSVSGETVEFAGRLAAGNLAYGSHIMLGAATFQGIESEMLARPLELLRRKDEILPREVYELIGENSANNPSAVEIRDRFWDAIVLFREQRFEQALELFEKCRPAHGTDPVVETYMTRIQEKLGTGVARDWDSSRLLTGL